MSPARRAGPAFGPLLGALLGALLLSGCSSSDDEKPPGRGPHDLAASVAQFRFDEGTRDLSAGITNNGRAAIRVSRATISWEGMSFPTVVPPADDTLPGQTAAFTITYGTPRCARAPRTPPVLLARVDGIDETLPLEVQDPGLLDRLRAKACAQQLLDRVATVRFELADEAITVGGRTVRPGRIVVEHRPGAVGPVDLVDLDGSVLITLTPRPGRRLPARLSATARRLVLPVLFGSTSRCDGHSLGQSQQTFLLSAYVRLDGKSPLREVLGLTTKDRAALQSVIDRNCRAG